MNNLLNSHNNVCIMSFANKLALTPVLQPAIALSTTVFKVLCCDSFSAAFAGVGAVTHTRPLSQHTGKALECL